MKTMYFWHLIRLFAVVVIGQIVYSKFKSVVAEQKYYMKIHQSKRQFQKVNIGLLVLHSF